MKVKFKRIQKSDSDIGNVREISTTLFPTVDLVCIMNQNFQSINSSILQHTMLLNWPLGVYIPKIIFCYYQKNNNNHNLFNINFVQIICLVICTHISLIPRSYLIIYHVQDTRVNRKDKLTSLSYLYSGWERYIFKITSDE